MAEGPDARRIETIADPSEPRRNGRTRWRVRRLAGARLVSVGGSQAAELALVYQVYTITRSGAWVVTALLATVSVGGFMGPLSGWVADRFDRRRVMVASELAAGAAYLAMVWVHAPVGLVVGAAAATALGAPFRAASAAAIPNLVGDEDLGWANALLGTASNAALVAGPLVGGVLVAASGAGLVFGVNAASFVISAGLIVGTVGAFGGRLRTSPNRSAAHHLFAGFEFLAADRILAPLAASGALAYASFGAALVIDPLLARAFHAGSLGYGLLTTVWGAGAVLGAIVAGRIVTPARAPNAVICGMIAMAVSLGSIAVIPTFTLIVAAGAVGGVGSGLVFIPWLVVIQRHTPDAVRGRVIGATDAFQQIAFLIGMGIAVPIIAIVGPHRAYATAGVALAIATLFAQRARHNATRASPARPG